MNQSINPVFCGFSSSRTPCAACSTTGSTRTNGESRVSENIINLIYKCYDNLVAFLDDIQVQCPLVRTLSIFAFFHKTVIDKYKEYYAQMGLVVCITLERSTSIIQTV